MLKVEPQKKVGPQKEKIVLKLIQMIFSVIIPTYNRKHLLKKCLNSLLNQTFPKDEYEVIVVDDGSPPEADSPPHPPLAEEADVSLLTGRRQTSIPFHFLTQEHRGPAAARNLGIKKAQGEIIAFTDDDCVPPANWLEKLYDGFKRHPEVAVVSGYQEAPEEILQKNLIAQYERFQTRALYRGKDKEIIGGFETPGGVTNNMAVKRKVFDKVGLFDENFPVPAGEDADLKKRIANARFKFLYLPLKVEHYQEYSLRGFLRQQKTRGIGGRYFREKWGRGGVNWLLPLKSFPRFFVTWWKSRSLKMAGLEFLGRMWMVGGQLRNSQHRFSSTDLHGQIICVYQ